MVGMLTPHPHQVVRGPETPRTRPPRGGVQTPPRSGDPRPPQILGIPGMIRGVSVSDNVNIIMLCNNTTTMYTPKYSPCRGYYGNMVCNGVMQGMLGYYHYHMHMGSPPHPTTPSGGGIRGPPQIPRSRGPLDNILPKKILMVYIFSPSVLHPTYPT